VRTALCAALLSILCGCAYLPRGGYALPRCPGELPPSEPGGDFVARERVRFEHRDRVVQLDVVVQKRGDELVVIGFSPTGAKLFSAVQRGQTLEIDALPAAVLAVPPRNVVLDIHRLRGLSRGPGDEVRLLRPACETGATWTLVSERVLSHFPPDAGQRSLWRS